MMIPKSLRPGDTVALVGPSGEQDEPQKPEDKSAEQEEDKRGG